MSLMSLCIVFLIGAALGLRFNFVTLFPATGLTIIGFAGVGIERGDHIGTVMQTIALVVVALQIGYFFGLVAHAAIASLSAHERHSAVAKKLGLR